MTEKITREKHPGRVAQVQSTEQSSVQSKIQPTVQSTVQPSVQSNDTCVYGVGMLAVLAIGVCVFFAYNTFQSKNKKLINEKQDQPPNGVICFRKIYNK